MLCLLLHQYELVIVCTRNLRQHYLILATNVSGLYFCRVVIVARQKTVLDSMQPSHLTVFSALNPRQKGNTVVTNTVREAVFHAC